jgi:class 3 adenylate cyclase
MAIYMDVHDGLGDATMDDVAEAHQRDLVVQDKYGVRYLSYWFNDPEGKAFCLVEAPSADAAKACHKEAHGLMPHDIIEVGAPTLANFMGDFATDSNDRALLGGEGSEPDTGLRIILFTDIEGSTDIATRLGDDVAMAVLQSHDSIVRDQLSACNGREIKHTGDGILASFTSVTAALRATSAMQQHANNDEHLAIKIGMSAGEPVDGSDDIYGASVNLAARICAHANGGQILVASTVRDLAIGKDVEFTNQGPIALKGFPEPVQLFEVV